MRKGRKTLQMDGYDMDGNDTRRLPRGRVWEGLFNGVSDCASVVYVMEAGCT